MTLFLAKQYVFIDHGDPLSENVKIIKELKFIWDNELNEIFTQIQFKQLNAIS